MLRVPREEEEGREDADAPPVVEADDLPGAAGPGACRRGNY